MKEMGKLYLLVLIFAFITCDENELKDFEKNPKKTIFSEKNFLSKNVKFNLNGGIRNLPNLIELCKKFGKNYAMKVCREYMKRTICTQIIFTLGTDDYCQPLIAP